MNLFTGDAVLESKDGLYGKGKCINGIKVGRWIYFHGKLEISYDENGLKNGVSKEYYSNGNIKTLELFFKGKIVGESKSFYENGQLKSLYKYCNNGQRINYFKYYSNGKISHYQEFDQDKKNLLKREIWYKEDGSLWLFSRHVKGSMIYSKKIKKEN